MARSTPSAVVNPFRSESFRPVRLLWIEAGALTLRYTDYNVDIEWGGVTFARRPFALSAIATSDVAMRKGVTIQLADADAEFQSQLGAGADFYAAPVRIYRTDLDAMESGGGGLADALRDDFIVESWTRTQVGVVIECISLLGLLDRIVPARTVTLAMFPGIPDADAI